MRKQLPKSFRISPEITGALKKGLPVVALESTVITHGLPFPENLTLAMDMEGEVRAQNAVPATIALLQGKICVGLQSEELDALAQEKECRKISVRDVGPAVAQQATGGTTVAGTLVAAQTAGIRVFATGGIGGVHRGAPFDVSTDLQQLASSPLVVICAGAKAILDLPATLEVLETLAVPVIGYQTNDFPAFYSRKSGLQAPFRADSPQEIAEIAAQHWALGLKSALLVVNPVPEEYAVPSGDLEKVIDQALQEMEAQGIRGQGVSPFLLARVSQLSHGSSLKANLALLKNNARLAGQIAGALANSNSQIKYI